VCSLIGGDDLSYLYLITYCYSGGGRLTQILLYRQDDLFGQGGIDEIEAHLGAFLWECYSFGEESHGLSLFEVWVL